MAAVGGSRPPSEQLQPISGSTFIDVKLPTPPTKKTDKMQDIRNCWAKPSCKVCCLAILILLIAAIVVAVVLTQVLALPVTLNWDWTAPEILRRGDGTPNQFRMQVADQQVRIEHQGATPFRSNYVSIIDFRTNKVAVIDSSLKNGGQNLVCFVINLDRNDIKSMEHFQRAARNGANKKSQTNGWQEQWNFIATPSNNVNLGSQLFRPEIAECRGARWVELTYTSSYQKNFKCAECYDFCLPHYFIDHDNIRDDTYLNIKQRDCFYHFIPEWRGFAQGQQISNNNLIPNLPTPIAQLPSNVPLSQLINQPVNSQNGQNLQGFQNQQNQGQFNGQNQNFGQGFSQNGNGFTQNGQSIGSGVQSGIGTIGQGVQQIGQSLGQNPTIQRIGSAIGNAAESHWINLQKTPEQIANFSREAVQNLQTNVNQWGQTLFGNSNGNNNGNGNQNGQNQPNHPMTPSQMFSASQNNGMSGPVSGQTFNNPNQDIPFTARNIDANPPQFNQNQFNPNQNINNNPNLNSQIHEVGTAVRPPQQQNSRAHWNPQTGWQQEGQQQQQFVGGPQGQSFGRDLSQQQNSPQFNDGWVNVQG